MTTCTTPTSSIPHPNPSETKSARASDTHLASDGLTAAGGTPEEFAALMKSEIERWGTLVKAKGVKLD